MASFFNIFQTSDFSYFGTSAGFGGAGQVDTGTLNVGDSMTFDGGSGITVVVDDDDSVLSDGYVETGTASTLLSSVTLNGVTYPAGSTIELEFIWDTTSDSATVAPSDPLVIRINGANVGFAFRDGYEPSVGQTYTIADGDSEGVNDGASVNYSELSICFAKGTLIKTATGDKAVENLRKGDFVLTMDNGLQPIRWIGSTSHGKLELEARPELYPVRIKAGALQSGLPEQDLFVSRQHRIMLRSAIVERMFGTIEILVAAIKLVSLKGVDIISDVDAVEYFHVLFDKHEVIWSNGVPTESLLTGAEALKAVSPDARAEIEVVLPQITRPDFSPGPARLIPQKGPKIRTLIERHYANNHQVLNIETPSKMEPRHRAV